MNDKNRIIYLVVIMMSVALLSTGVTFTLLYRTGFNEEKARLTEIAHSQARFIESVAMFNESSGKYSPDEIYETTLEQVFRAHEKYAGFGDTGEFALASLDGDSIRFILSHRKLNLNTPMPVPLGSHVAEPMQRALSGETGTMVGLDYMGHKVLAAYEPVKSLNIGLVAKIDLKEIHAPFIRTGIITIVISSLIILLGVFSFWKISNPFIEKLKSHSARLEEIVDARTRELRESELKFRMFFDHSPEGIVFLDRDGILKDINPAGMELLGMDWDSSDIHINVRECLSPRDVEVIISNLREKKFVRNYHCDLINLQKQTIRCALSLFKIRDENGKTVAIQGIIQDLSEQLVNRRLIDITNLKDQLKLSLFKITSESEDKLTDNWRVEDFIRKLAQTCYNVLDVKAFVFFHYSKEENKFINSAIITSHKAVENMRTKHPQFAHNMQFPIFMNNIMQQALKSDKIIYLEDFKKLGYSETLNHHHNIFPDSLIALIPIKLFGSTWGLAGIVLDKNSKTRTIMNDVQLDIETAIQHMTELNFKVKTKKEIMELASYPMKNPMPIIAYTGEKKLVYQNQAAKNILAASGSADTTIESLLPGDYVDNAIQCLSTDESIGQIEVNFNGATYLWYAYPLPELNRVHFYATDITELKKTEESLRKAKEKAEKSEKVKSLFLENMSHEIRTPLNAIIGYSDLINQTISDRLEEEEKFFLEAIQHSGIRLMRTVHEILDISTIETGTYECHFEIFDIIELLNSLVLEQKNDAVSKNLTLMFDAQVKHRYVKYDRNGIEHSISNIINNAIKYTKKGGVTVTATEKDEKLYISISDTGVGIEPGYLDHMYEIFTQESEGFSKDYQGIGLGLSIVKRFMDMNDIPINVESEKNKGTVFTLTLRWIDPEA